MAQMPYQSSILTAIVVAIALLPADLYADTFSDLWIQHGGRLLDSYRKPTVDPNPVDNNPPVLHINEGWNHQILADHILISGVVEDDSSVVNLSIDNNRIEIDDGGRFDTKIYVPVGDSALTVHAVDLFGNRTDRSIQIKRMLKVPEHVATKLNPPEKTVDINKNAVALIVGLDGYKHIPSAPWAEEDARIFYDYAVNVLGVHPNKITLLLGEDSNMNKLWKSLEQWLPMVVEPHKTNIYIFFSGHGLATPDGNDSYLIPWDGDPSILERTAIHREEMIEGLSFLKPASVVMFMDTCYSGAAKGGKKTLVADARALRVVRKDRRSILPENFTLFSAAANDEIASSHPTLEHGLFSYWMMRGLGGEADGNSDNKITAGELHSFVGKNVERDAVSIGRKQHPQLVGDAERVVAAW